MKFIIDLLTFEILPKGIVDLVMVIVENSFCWTVSFVVGIIIYLSILKCIDLICLALLNE